LEGSPEWPADMKPPANPDALRLWDLPQYLIKPIGSKASMSETAHKKWKSEIQRDHKSKLLEELQLLKMDFAKAKARVAGRKRARRNPIDKKLAAVTAERDQALADRDAALASYGSGLGERESARATIRKLEREKQALAQENDRLQALINGVEQTSHRDAPQSAIRQTRRQLHVVKPSEGQDEMPPGST
jgi:chromosome segregation ATPase